MELNPSSVITELLAMVLLWRKMSCELLQPFYITRNKFRYWMDGFY